MDQISVSFIIGYLGICSIVLIASLALSRLMIRINLVDIPNRRSTHSRPTPTAGGVGIAGSFCGVACALYLGADHPWANHGPILAFVTLGAAVSAFGLLDDVRPLRPLQKLVPQSIAAAAFCGFVGHIDRLWLPGLGLVQFGFLGYVLTFIWLVGFTNAFNCLDGLNGLAGTGALIGAGFLAGIAFFTGAALVAVIASMLFAATLGFFVFNFPRGRIFMGDAGSQFLGFMFAALAVMGASVEDARISFYIVPMVFYLFIFDFVATLWIRLVRKQQVLDGHREYLFHICHRLGLSQSQVCALYSIIFLQNGIAASFAQWGPPWQAVTLVVAVLPLHVAFGYLVYTLGHARGLYADVVDEADGESAIRNASSRTPVP